MTIRGSQLELTTPTKWATVCFQLHWSLPSRVAPSVKIVTTHKSLHKINLKLHHMASNQLIYLIRYATALKFKQAVQYQVHRGPDCTCQLFLLDKRQIKKL